MRRCPEKVSNRLSAVSPAAAAVASSLIEYETALGRRKPFFLCEMGGLLWGRGRFKIFCLTKRLK